MGKQRRIGQVILAATAAVGLAAGLTPTAAADQPQDRPLPPFHWSSHPVSEQRLGPSWEPDCPVGPEQLRLVKLSYVDLDGYPRRGELIVHEDVVEEVAEIFGSMYERGFPLERMETIDKYDADDDASMAANNSSAFNCRPITGGDGWSVHSYGKAIDINPKLNPYISDDGEVLPPNGEPWADRDRDDPGMIHDDDATVRAFEEHGWEWGGYWTTPLDYQHFEKPLDDTEAVTSR